MMVSGACFLRRGWQKFYTEFYNKNKSFGANSVEAGKEDFDIRNKQEKFC